MSTDDPDIALVRTAFESFDVGRTDIDAYFQRFWQPDAVIEAVDGFPVPGSYRGLDGYRRWFDESYGPYEDVRRHLDAITKEGDRVVALLTITGRSREDGFELEVRVGNTYQVEDGRISRLCIYVGHERALDAARSG